MALPVSLRNSVAPTELELIASEQLIEIIPLIAMERTAFISVSSLLKMTKREILGIQVYRVRMGHYDLQRRRRYPYGWP